MNIVDKLKSLVAERQALFTGSIKNDKEIDASSVIIRKVIKDHRDHLPLELIIESLTHLGAAPNILYDDNGHFTVASEGSQNLPTYDEGFETEETEFHASWIVPPGGWKKTIREALNAYLDQEGEE